MKTKLEWPPFAALILAIALMACGDTNIEVKTDGAEATNSATNDAETEASAEGGDGKGGGASQ